MKTIWKSILQNLQKNFPQDYNLWFIQLQAISLNKKEKKLLLGVANPSTLSIIKERFEDILNTFLKQEMNDNDFTVEFIVDANQSSLFTKEKEVQEDHLSKKKSFLKTARQENFIPDINPKFTFERFVPSSSTDIAFKAAQLIAKQTGPNFDRFNPFFIYGGVGLGKTHIIQAIANYMVEHTPYLKIIYVTAEKYMNDYIEVAISKDYKSFRNFYREANVLLIDDVQFLEKKEKIQDEIFNNFNKLYQNNQQIIFTCDKHPKNLKNIQERLINRFSWGLTVDVKPPDFATRKVILEKKLKEINIEQFISEEILNFLAENITENIRDIESAVTKIDSILLLTKSTLSIPLLQEELKHLLTSIRVQSKGISILIIQNIVCEYYHISIADLKSKNRSHHIAFPRHMAIYICKQILPLSLSKIGEEFGDRDHSTILSSIKKIESEMKKILSIRNDYEEILKKLTNEP
jgi:chromosomal replication initiator protein